MAKWFDPSAIRFKISPHDDLGPIEGGNWDIERRYPLTEAVKHRSIIQRYSEGVRWEDTELFTDIYSRRIRQEPIRGEATYEGLIAQYYGRVDSMFRDLEKNGFRNNTPLPRLLIGRDGEIFIGNQGNHRLAMAQVIGLSKIAGEVICRHRSPNGI